jgi:putative membrane protein
MQPSGGATPDQAGNMALNDNEIAAIVAAANTGEVEQAKLAQTKAKEARVKKFAAHMISEHTDAGQKETQVMTKAGLKSEENPVSSQLTSDSTKLVESLRTQNGMEFDRMYIDAQVKQHQQLLDMIDHKFMANVKSPDLKGFLQTLRSKVETHLKEAREIQKSLPAK